MGTLDFHTNITTLCYWTWHWNFYLNVFYGLWPGISIKNSSIVTVSWLARNQPFALTVCDIFLWLRRTKVQNVELNSWALFNWQRTQDALGLGLLSLVYSRYYMGGSVAEWLEHWIWNPFIAGSNPILTTSWCADVVHGSSKSNFSAMLVHSQLVCLLPVGNLNLVMFIWIFICHCPLTLVLKSPSGEWPIM